MNVVVSAIVDPWVTTLSFVVALAMKIQGEKIGLDESAHDTTLDPKGTSRKARLKSTKNLCLRHRFFNKIRQIYRFFNAFRQKLQIL